MTPQSQNVPRNVSAAHTSQTNSSTIQTQQQPQITNISNNMNRRTVGAYNTVQKFVKESREILTMNRQPSIKYCRAELDSHADTCGVNDTAYVLEYTGQVAEVAGFSSSIGSLSEVPIVKAVLAYDPPSTGETIILIINQALYFKNNIEHILLNPNQLRTYGLEVDDIPKHLSEGKSTHSIYIPDSNLRIPIKLNGVISYFNVRTPTPDKIHHCETIKMTLPSIEWQPCSDKFNQQEQYYESEDESNIYRTNSAFKQTPADLTDVILRQIFAVKTNNKSLMVNEATLSKQWAVPISVAENTIKASTQNFIRSALHPIEHRYKTKNVTLRYLNCHFTSDTFFSNKPSLLQNTCAQLFLSELDT